MGALFPSRSSPPRKPKTHVSLGLLPRFIDEKQPPTKPSPWHQILSTPFISSLSMTLPATTHDKIWPQLRVSSTPSRFQYAKVILKLQEILTSDFYTHYIRIGNILLITEGRPGVSDWLATIVDGKLRMEMSRNVYERCGLQGVPLDSGGGARKHTKERWVVEMDLRAPSMVRGRKGFERLIRASEEVLNQGRLWLFRDLSTKIDTSGEEVVLSSFHPTWIEMYSKTRDVSNVQVPALLSPSALHSNDADSLRLQDDLHELIEYLDLVRLKSPRIQKDDQADPHISRYSVPDIDESIAATDLKVVTWTGLLDRAWSTQLLIDVIRQSRKAGGMFTMEDWVVLTVNAHRTEALGQINGCITILQPNERPTEEGNDRATNPDIDAFDTGKGENRSTGLEQFTCLQFVDTTTV